MEQENIDVKSENNQSSNSEFTVLREYNMELSTDALLRRIIASHMEEENIQYFTKEH